MPVAPRYSPEGVRIGEMPTPRVSAQTGLAEGLASVGESIAGIGKTIDRAQATQAQREAALEHATKVKADVAAAGGQEGFKKWKQEWDTKYQKLGIEAQGSLAMPKVKEFQESMAQVNPDNYLPKGYTPEMATEFQKRVEFESQTFKGASDNMALDRNRTYIVGVSKDELKDSVSAASNALAEQNDDVYLSQLGRSIEAAKRISGITGQPVDEDEIVGAAAFGAIQRIASKSPELAVERYEELKQKNRLGKAAANAEQFIAPIKRGIALDNKFQEIAYQSTAESGIFDAKEAMGRINGLDMTGEEKENLQIRVSKHADYVEKQREAIGDEVLMQLGVMQSEAGFDFEKFQAVPGMRQKLDVMTPKQLIVLRDRVSRGPEQSNPVHKEWANSLLNTATTAAERSDLMAIKRNDLSLSQADWERFDKERNKVPDPVEDEVRKRLLNRWDDFGAKKPLPQATRDKELSSDEAQEVAQFDATRRYVMTSIANNKAAQIAIKKGESIQPFIDKAYDEASQPHEVTFEGRKITTTIGASSIYGLPFVVTDDIAERAGNPSRDDPLWRSKVWKAKADMDAEAEALARDKELSERLRADSRPMTDAEMLANRERIGAAWRSAKAGGRDPLAASLGSWQVRGNPAARPLTQDEEDAQYRARAAKPMGTTVTGPNADWRDF